MKFLGKLSLALLGASSPLWALPPIIAPSTPVVYLGGTVQFTSPDSVTWSLSPGSTGTISAGGLYTAPHSSFAAKNVVAGCPARPNDDIYNTRIDNLPVDANSTARINNVASAHLEFDVAFPANVYTNATPTTNLISRYTPENDGAYPLLSFPYLGAENAATPNNTFTQDQHVLGVNTDTCRFSELFHFYTIGTDPECLTCNTESEVGYYGMSYRLPDVSLDGGGGTDAAGMFLQPLAIRYSELKSGAIKHAMRFSLPNGYIYSGRIWPAVAFTNECNTLGTCFPYGSRLRLKSSFNITGYSPTAKTILIALKQYGMFMVDGGGSMHIQTATDVTSDTTTWDAIFHEIPFVSTISPSNFEQVDESSLMESSFSSHVNLTNPYVVPDNYASVIATRISDNVTSTQAVAIEPVTVGTKNLPFTPNAGTLAVMAGTPQFQIPYWVKGTTTTTVTCTMSPSSGNGTLTSSCLYTAPQSKHNSISTTTVTITPTADPAQALSFPLIIYPSDGIRINVGGKSSALLPAPPYTAAGDYGPDVDGNIWFSDPIGTVSNWFEKNDISYPQGSWANVPDVGLYYTQYRGGSDQGYSAMVPNGTYLLSLGFADIVPSVVTASSISIDSQGLVLLSTASVSSVPYVPKVFNYVVKVANQQFYFAIRQVVWDQYTFLDKWSLTPLPASIGCSGGARMSGGLKL